MRYLLIDHVTEVQSNSLIRGIKNITMSEDFFSFHFPDNPVMPGALLLEALVQLAGWLEAESSGFNNWVLLHKIRKCRYYGFARPGDRVRLEVIPLTPENPYTRMYKGVGKVNGKKFIDAQFAGSIDPLSRHHDLATAKHFFQILTRACGFRPDG